MQKIIILLVVIGCAVLVGRRLFRSLRGRETGCGCGCSGCDLPPSCHYGDKEGPRKRGADQCKPAVPEVKMREQQAAGPAKLEEHVHR